MDNPSYKNALQEHQAGNFDAAEKLYRDILAITLQNSIEALHNFGLILLLLKKLAS